MYDQGQRLPQDFYRLYDAVVSQVLHKRYLTENERDRVRFRLEAIALGMHWGGGKRETPAAEVGTDEIDRHLADYKRDDPTIQTGAFDAAQTREDLLSDSGLLLPRSGGRAAFYHLSFQEFLAAVRLKRIALSLAEVLARHASTPAWRRTLTFLFCTIADRDSPKAALDGLASLLPTLEPGRLEQDPNPALLLADCLEVAHGRGWNLEQFAGHFKRACDHALGHLNPPERAHLWRTLGSLGWDDRPWVGLQPDRLGLGDRVGLIPDIAWVEVPAGPFRYGNKKQQITLPAFRIARYPVTNVQFQCFINDGGYEDEHWWEGLAENPLSSGDGWTRAGRWNGPNLPREHVSWYEAVAFCRWLTAKLQEHGLLAEAMTVRLPTEQEWEKAARGDEGRKFPWGDDFQSGRANINETYGNAGSYYLGQTTVVGIYPLGTSPYGLLDMSGNIWEWCLNEYSQPKQIGTESDKPRVLRGGSWLDFQDLARCAYRDDSRPDYRDYDLGFRLVCCVSPPS